MAQQSEQMTERAQLVRVYEASCGIDYPTADDLNFRLAVAKKIGLAFGLRELRQVKIDGPATSTPTRPVSGALSKLK
jgi:hypothetical protein